VRPDPCATPADAVPDGLIPAEVLASPTPVAVYGYVRAKQGRAQDLLKEIRAIIEPTHSDDGCQQYAVHTTRQDPNAFAFYERWACGPDLLDHVSQPFMQNYFAVIQDLIEGDFETHWLIPTAP
jgi:quinol monooxygenase YgiN